MKRSLKLLAGGLSLGLLAAPSMAAEKLTFAAPKFVETEAMAELGKEIAAKYGYELEPVWFTFDATREKLVVDFTGGASNWDLVYVDSKWVPEFAKLGLVSPLDELRGAGYIEERALDFDDLIDIHVARQMYEEKVWAMPILAAYNALAYRRDLFESEVEREAFRQEYGRELTPPRTYDEYREVAEFFTRKAGDKLDGEELGADFYGLVHSNKRGGFLWHDYLNVHVAFGADIIFDPETMQPTWNSLESLAAAKFYKEMMAFQPSGNINMTSGEATSIFASGAAATQVEFLNRLVSVVENPESSKIADDVAYVLPPTQDPERPHAFIVNTNGVGVYSRSRNKEAAFKVLSEILSAAGQKRMMLENPGYLPTRSSVWADPEVAEAYPGVAEFVKLVETGQPYTFQHPQIPEYPQVEEIATNALHDVLAGSETVEDAFGEAQEKIEKVFRKANYID